MTQNSGVEVDVTQCEEAEEIIIRREDGSLIWHFFRDAILLPMQYPVLNAIYDAIYDAWLTYINYMHVLDADSDYEIEDDYMYFINEDSDENSDNDEDSDSDEDSESLYCRCGHYSVDNNTEENDTEDEHSENGVSDGYDDCDENSDNDEGSDSDEGSESLYCNCRCRHIV